MAGFMTTTYSYHDIQANHCHFVAQVPTIEINWRLTKYIFLCISLWPVQNIPPISQVLAMFLLAAEGRWRDGLPWSALARSQTFRVGTTLGFAMIITRDLTLAQPWPVLSVSVVIEPPARSVAKHSTSILQKSLSLNQILLVHSPWSPGRYWQENPHVCSGQVLSFLTALVPFVFSALWRRSKQPVFIPGMQNFKILLAALFQYLEIFIN